MKRRLIVAGLFGALLAGSLWWWQWKLDRPRRASLQTVERLHKSLTSGSIADLLDCLVLPAALHSRTPHEQDEFLRKALGDELSPEGIAVLRKHAIFGPLNEVFTQEADAWAAQAGVNADDCVAFKLERNGLSAEVVLVNSSSIQHPESSIRPAYRVVRCNNVKQMAPEMTNDELRISRAGVGNDR